MRFATTFVVVAAGLMMLSENLQAAGPITGPKAPPAAAAPTPTDIARERAEKGADLFSEGHYVEALGEFTAAYEIMPVPTVEIMVARTQAKLQKLIEATTTYRHIMSAKLAPDAPPQFFAAQREAESELAVTEMQIPRIRIIFEGETSKSAKIVVDGVLRTKFEVPLELNPGTHTIEITLPEKSALVRNVNLERGRIEDIVVGEKSPVVERRILPPNTPSGRVLPTLGFIALGLGAVGVGLGSWTGLRAIDQKDIIKNNCNQVYECNAVGLTAANDAKQWASISTISSAAGIALLASSIPIFYYSYKADKPIQRPRVSVFPIGSYGMALRVEGGW